MKTIDNYCYLCAAIKITPSFLNNRERIDFLFAFNKLFGAFSLPHSIVSHLIFCNIVTGFCFVFVLFEWLAGWLAGWLVGWLVSLNVCVYWLVGVRASHTKTNLASGPWCVFCAWCLMWKFIIDFRHGFSTRMGNCFIFLFDTISQIHFEWMRRMDTARDIHSHLAFRTTQQ